MSTFRQPLLLITVAAICAGGWSTPVSAATATFTPVGSTVVVPGTSVIFELAVAVESLPRFDAADIIIGSDEATDIEFVFGAAWRAAFTVVLPVLRDVGFYVQDVFVSSNTAATEPMQIVLGTVTVNTTGMSEGTYEVRIEPSVVPGVSSLTLDGRQEPLSGVGTFRIECVYSDADCDNDVDAADFQLFFDCLAGPGGALVKSCGRFDSDKDGDVDLADTATLWAVFTGQE